MLPMTLPPFWEMVSWPSPPSTKADVVLMPPVMSMKSLPAPPVTVPDKPAPTVMLSLPASPSIKPPALTLPVTLMKSVSAPPLMREPVTSFMSPCTVMVSEPAPPSMVPCKLAVLSSTVSLPAPALMRPATSLWAVKTSLPTPVVTKPAPAPSTSAIRLPNSAVELMVTPDDGTVVLKPPSSATAFCTVRLTPVAPPEKLTVR